MTVRFNFKHEGGAPHVTTLSSNLMLARHDAIKTKVNRILLSSAFFLLFVFLSAGVRLGWFNIFAGGTCFVICLIAAFVSLYFLIDGLLWQGPKAVLLLTVMYTENFEEYINASIQAISDMISYESVKLTFMGKRERRALEKELVCAQILKEMAISVDEYVDLYSAVQFVADNYINLNSFIIKEVF